MLTARESKVRKKFGEFLKKQKKSHNYALASALIEVFSEDKKITGYKQIKSQYLKDKGIIPCDKHKTFTSWREDMIGSGILICMASKEERLQKEPFEKAGMFRCGPKIEKYIKEAIAETIPERIDNITDKIDDLQSTKADRSELVELRREIEEMKNSNDKAASFFLQKYEPPDTPERRKIIVENIGNPQKIPSLLKNMHN
jgi:hypothetical protein